MAGGDTAEEEGWAKDLVNKNSSSFAGVFPLMAYKANGNLADVKKIINEEVMHFITIRGWSEAFP